MPVLIRRYSVSVSIWVAVALVGPACATAFAQAPAIDAQEPSKLAPTDRAFARAAADDAQAEVAIAALAQQTTSSSIVRMFAEDMQRVYLEIADELREIGNRKHQPLPNVVSADDQVTLDELSHLTGGEFDRAFAENVVAAHRDAIAAFQLYASSGADPELRGFADRRLPKLRRLLAAAEDVRKSGNSE
jgi:putative membrane protein